MENNILSLLQSKGKQKQVKHQAEYAKKQFPLSKETVKIGHKKKTVLSDDRKRDLIKDDTFT